MTSKPKPEKETQTAMKQSFWSWKDDEFIAQGKFSWLAFGEIFLAMAFYWWMANYFERPWVLLISICAAPMLMLRSENSILRGLDLLIVGERGQVIKKQSIAWGIYFICMIVGASLSYWLLFDKVHHWLSGQLGWQKFLLSAIFGAAVASSAVIAKGVIAGRVAKALAVTVAGAGALAIAGAVTLAFGGAIAITGSDAYVGASLGTFVILAIITKWGKLSLAIMYAILIAIAHCLISICIRFWATLTHLKAGLAAFSHNWVETVLVSDLRHAPALLPLAGEVNGFFNVAGLLKMRSSKLYVSVSRWVIAGIFYLTATLYRWNIKASAFLWGPIALALSPTIWSPMEMREKTALWSDKWLFGLSAIAASYFLAILAIPVIPDYIVSALPNICKTELVTALRPPISSLRYLLLVLFTLGFTWQLLKAFQIRSPHDKPLSSEADFLAYKEDRREALNVKAMHLRRILKINTCIAILAVWAFVLKYAVTHYPQVTAFKLFVSIASWL